MSEEKQTGGSVGVVQTQIAEIALPPGGLRLDHGDALSRLDVAYETYGELSPARDNVVFVCHALTGSAHVAGRHEPDDPSDVAWWDEMVGPGKGIDTRYYHVVCANILGGCKGTTGPSSIDPRTGKPYGGSFPPITVGDIVSVHRLLLQHLGIERVATVIGGSFGGMQVLEWAVRFPDSVDRCVCIASAASLSTQALAFDAVGRGAITSDTRWRDGDYYDSVGGPDSGLALARRLGHITYLSPELMKHKFGRERRQSDDADPQSAAAFQSVFQVESYLEHQGRKFVGRFDANSYLQITRAMDEYELGAEAGGLDAALARVEAKMLVVALSDDWLFPPAQSVELANSLMRAGKRVSYCRLHAPQGHDAFLVDVEHLANVLHAFLPWVSGEKHRARPSAQGDAVATPRTRPPTRGEYDVLVGMVHPGSRVLDLGCGGGDLLTRLAEERNVTCMGVDIDLDHVIEVIDRGHDISQSDVDAGLAMIPDGAYDYAILSETLQVVRNPLPVLKEMLRVAKVGIVSFPNFGKWDHLVHLCLHGRMPKSAALPFEWYETPNIHLFTLRDFGQLCRDESIDILEVVCIPEGVVSRGLVRLRMCNLGADRAIVKIARRGTEASGPSMRTGGCRPLES